MAEIKTEEITTSKPRTMCEVCSAEVAKYTCPKCSLHTCSLPCVRQHKENNDCSGKRNKTAFIAVDDFTDSDLRSDYSFLEELKREVDLSKKEGVKFEYKDFSRRVKFLLRYAKQRGVYIDLMPRGMSRHVHNSTIYHIESQTIHWHIEWKFPEENMSFCDERVPDVEIMQDVIQRHVTEHRQQMSLTKSEQNCLEPYSSDDGTNYCVLFKIYGRKKFCLLDKTKSVYENLTGKRVVEYPTFYVVPEKLVNTYNLLSADQEEEIMKFQRKPMLPRFKGRRGRRGRGHRRGADPIKAEN